MRVQDIVLKCVITIEVILYKYSRHTVWGTKGSARVFVAGLMGVGRPLQRQKHPRCYRPIPEYLLHRTHANEMLAFYAAVARLWWRAQHMRDPPPI